MKCDARWSIWCVHEWLREMVSLARFGMRFGHEFRDYETICFDMIWSYVLAQLRRVYKYVNGC